MLSGSSLNILMRFRTSFFILLFIVLPKMIFGQHFFRIQGNITVKEKTEVQSQLTIGKFYYDKNTGKIVYDISFPEKQVMVSKDTVLYQFVNGELKSRTRTFNMAQFSVFNLSLNNQLTNYGLENSFYSIDNVEKEGDLVITTWIPERSKRKYFGKVLISTRNKRLHGVVFYNAQGKVAGKQFFEDYAVINGLSFPMKIVRINYVDETESYQITTFENIQLNNLNETYFYDYPLPPD
jgi:hypothetical protein